MIDEARRGSLPKSSDCRESGNVPARLLHGNARFIASLAVRGPILKHLGRKNTEQDDDEFEQEKACGPLQPTIAKCRAGGIGVVAYSLEHAWSPRPAAGS
jgi:hypothetical protein